MSPKAKAFFEHFSALLREYDAEIDTYVDTNYNIDVDLIIYGVEGEPYGESFTLPRYISEETIEQLLREYR